MLVDCAGAPSTSRRVAYFADEGTSFVVLAEAGSDINRFHLSDRGTPHFRANRSTTE